MGNNKVRVYKTSIIKQMKKLYGGQCQLCGCRPFETFDVDICEAHHIDYFVKSLNNDASNQMILCPNHHSIIHDANPTFHRRQLMYVYPNGAEQKIVLNWHL